MAPIVVHHKTELYIDGHVKVNDIVNAPDNVSHVGRKRMKAQKRKKPTSDARAKDVTEDGIFATV